jgi:hypothetical protein
VSQGACLDALEKIKILFALLEIEPQLIKHPQHSLVTMLTKLYWLYSRTKKKKYGVTQTAQIADFCEDRIVSPQ